MTDSELKQEIIAELVAGMGCDFCEKFGLAERCAEKKGSCEELCEEYFKTVISVRQV